jgi:hypothetical protein
MAEVMDPQAWNAGRRDDLVPMHELAEVAPAQRTTLHTDEQEPVGTRRSMLGQVLGDVRQDEARQGDHTQTGRRFGRPEPQLAGGKLIEGCDDSDQAALDIHVATAQGDQLAPAQACERAEQYKRAESIRHPVSDEEHLPNGGDRTFRRRLRARTLHAARVTGEEIVIDRCREDRP